MLGDNPTEHVEIQINFNDVFDRRYYASMWREHLRCAQERNGECEIHDLLSGARLPQDCCRVEHLQWVDSRQLRLTAIDPKLPVESGSNRLTANIQLKSSPATSLLALGIPHSSNAESTYLVWLGII